MLLFLERYGAAQAGRGAMFSFAAFLGFDLQPGLHGMACAWLALIALFPSFLLIGDDLRSLASFRGLDHDQLTFTTRDSILAISAGIAISHTSISV